MNDLKPCPFCASDDLELFNEEEQVMIRCRDCDARGSSTGSKEWAERSWNQRPGEERWKQVAKGWKEYSKTAERFKHVSETDSCQTCKYRGTKRCDSPYPPSDDDWCGAYRRAK
jgi:Lar family restriction alleviation protein